MIIPEDIEKRLLKQKGKGKLGSDKQGGSKSHQLDKQTKLEDVPVKRKSL
jgi:hypothetical protein